jgi:hypothetical protein
MVLGRLLPITVVPLSRKKSQVILRPNHGNRRPHVPDDDRHTRDRLRNLDPLTEKLWNRARHARSSEGRSEELPFTEDKVLPQARRTFDLILEKLGEPDLEKASVRVRLLARTLKDDGGETLDLCAGHRTSGMQALLDQATSVVLACEDPDSLITMETEELAARIGEQFARAAIRRYSLDRTAPFSEGFDPDMTDTVEFLELLDLTFTTSILSALVKDLLR